VRKNPEIPRDVFFGEGGTQEPTPAGGVVRSAARGDEDKVQVTVYLSHAAAKRLEALRYHLLDEHNVKVSKSAIAEYAISQLNDDLAPVAEYFLGG
jgi:hypothetical protein